MIAAAWAGIIAECSKMLRRDATKPQEQDRILKDGLLLITAFVFGFLAALKLYQINYGF